MTKVKVLYVYGGIMTYGGIEKFLMNNYRHIDSTNVQIDFVFHGTGNSPFDEEFKNNNTNVFYVPLRSKNIFQNFYKLSNIMKKGNYDIVHSHMDAMNSYALGIAKNNNIKVRISHSHSTQHMTNSDFKIALNNFAKDRIQKNATHLFACSKEAGKWLYGMNAIENGKVRIIPNAIDIEKYFFSKTNREVVRKEFGVTSSDVLIGHVGTFNYPKNHMFLIEFFKKLSLSDNRYKLLLIGEGHLQNKIKNLVKRYNLEDKVIFAGVRNDVNRLLSGMDIFLLPSLFEGLPISLIEAQANGLQCLASTKVPKEVNHTGLIDFLSLDESIEKWTDKIIRISHNNYNRKDPYFSHILKENGYDIKTSAKKLEETYIKIKIKNDKDN